MSAEIDSVISSAMASLDSGGSDGGDSGDTGDTGDSGGTADIGTDLSTETSADESTDAGTESTEAGDGTGQPTEPAPDAGRSAEDLAFDAELAELGLSAPKPGQKDNRIPYSRMRKIVANAKTKWSEKLAGEHTAKLTASEKAYEEYKQSIAGVERLIETDPERYIQTLAQLYPQHYKKFLADGGQPDSKQAAAKKDPEPQADIRYDDGSFGFSPEQFSKLREWDRREAARSAKEETAKEFNERFGGMEQAYKQVQQQGQDVQRVRGHIDKLREQWGADTIDNQDVQKAIVKHMDDNPKATLVEATRTVVMNRLNADRTKMRTELLAEMKAAPKAASKTPVAPTKSNSTTSESVEDIIRSAMRGIK